MDGIEVGGTAPIRAVSNCLDEIAIVSQLLQSTFYRGAGELQVGSNGSYSRPALALPIRAILQVHIDRHGPVGDIRVGIDGSKVAHGSFSFLAMLPRAANKAASLRNTALLMI